MEGRTITRGGVFSSSLQWVMSSGLHKYAKRTEGPTIPRGSYHEGGEGSTIMSRGLRVRGEREARLLNEAGEGGRTITSRGSSFDHERGCSNSPLSRCAQGGTIRLPSGGDFCGADGVEFGWGAIRVDVGSFQDRFGVEGEVALRRFGKLQPAVHQRRQSNTVRRKSQCKAVS